MGNRKKGSFDYINCDGIPKELEDNTSTLRDFQTRGET